MQLCSQKTTHCFALWPTASPLINMVSKVTVSGQKIKPGFRNKYLKKIKIYIYILEMPLLLSISSKCQVTSVLFISAYFGTLDHGVFQQAHSTSNMGMAMFSVGRRLALSLPLSPVDFNSVQYASSSRTRLHALWAYFLPGPL